MGTTLYKGWGRWAEVLWWNRGLWTLSILLGGILLDGAGVRANDREDVEPITSPITAQTPYFVVFRSDSRPPGLYTTLPNGQKELLIPGPILRLGANPGVVRHLDLGIASARHEAIVVVDGRVFFVQQANHEEYQGASGSFLELGSPEMPLIDPLTSEKVAIPRVADLGDIVAVDHPTTDGRSAVLLSIRSKADGRSVVVGLVLRSKEADRPWSESQKSPAYLLEHGFLDAVGLQRLYARTPKGELLAYSTRLNASVVRAWQHDRGDELPSLIRRWMDRMQEWNRFLRGESLVDGTLYGDTSGRPHLDLLSGRAGSESRGIAHASEGVRSEVDVMSRTGSVTFSRFNLSMTGFFRERPDGTPIVFSKESGAVSAMAAVVDGRWVFVIQARDQPGPSVVQLPSLSIPGPDEMCSWAMASHALPGSDEIRVVLVRSVGASPGAEQQVGPGLTQAVLLRVGAKRAYAGLESVVEIAPRFFGSDSMLAARLVVEEWQEAPVVLFDDVSDSIREDNDRARSLLPWLDLGSDQRRRIFRRPIEHELIFDDDRVAAVRYQESPLLPGRWDNILVRTSAEGQRVLPGELLKQPGSSSPLLAVTSLSIGIKGRPKTEGDLVVVAIDPSRSGGRDTFRLMLVFLDVDRRVSPLVVQFGGSERFENLAYVSVYYDPDPTNHAIYLIAAHKDADDSKGRMLLYSARVVAAEGKRVELVETQGQSSGFKLGPFVPAHDLPGHVMRARAGGISGGLFWVTAGIDPEDSRYRAIRLVPGAQQQQPLTGRTAALRALQLAPLSHEEHLSTTEPLGAEGVQPWNRAAGIGIADYWTTRGHKFDRERLGTMSWTEFAQAEFPELSKFLESVADPQSAARLSILLVDESKKSALLHVMTALLEAPGMKNWTSRFGLSGRIEPFLAQQDRLSSTDIIENMRRLRDPGPFGTRGVLLGDMADIIEAGKAAMGAPDVAAGELTIEIDAPERDGVSRHVRPHPLLLIGAQGRTPKTTADLDLSSEASTRGILVATSEEYALVKDQLESVGQGAALAALSVDRHVLARGWRVQRHGGPTAFSAVRVSNARRIPERILPDVLTILDRVATPGEPHRNYVIVVPSLAFKGVVESAIWARWSGDGGGDQKWHKQNMGLRAHAVSMREPVPMATPQAAVPQLLNQRQILAELAAMRDRTEERSVGILTDFVPAQVSRAGVPQGNVAYRLRDSVEDSVTKGDVLPHYLYLLATEGNPVPANQFEEWRAQQQATMSMILVATRQEWEAIKGEAAFEARFGLFDAFDVVHVEPPSEATRRELVLEVVDGPAARQIGLKFTMDQPASDAEAAAGPQGGMHRFVNYLVRRSMRLEEQQGSAGGGGGVESFLRVLDVLRSELLTSATVRRGGVVDRALAERVISRAHGIGLNLNILPSDDPLRKLSDVPKMVTELTEAGHWGMIGPKQAYIKTILSQLSSVSDTRQIPSSVILFGENGTGKTSLWLTLVSCLGLKLYDFTQPLGSDVNAEAGAMLINFQQIQAREGEVPEDRRTLTADEVIERIKELLARPDGFRSFIFLDDVHKAPPEQFWKVFSFVQTIFDAPRGMFSFLFGERTFEIPTRHLNFSMALNAPPAEEARRLKTIEERIVSVLKGPKAPVDISLFRRWAKILNFETFPPDAKAPEVVNSWSRSAAQDFSRSGRLALVSSSAIRALVKKFPDLNVREFVGPSVGSFMELGGSEGDRGGEVSVAILRSDPLTQLIREEPLALNRTVDGVFAEDSSGSKRGSDHVQDWVSQEVTAVEVDPARPRTMMYLLPGVVDAARTSLHDVIATAASGEPVLNFGLGKALLGPLLHALRINLETRPEIPIEDVQIDARQFGFQAPREQSELAAWREQQRRSRAVPFEVLPVLHTSWSQDAVRVFSRDSARAVGPREDLQSRMGEVLVTLRKDLVDLARAHVAVMMQVPDLQKLGEISPEDWIERLEAREPLQGMRKSGKGLVDRYIRFVGDVGSILSSVSADVSPALRPYDLATMFLIAQDQAITQLPWGLVVRHLAGAMKVGATHPDKAQHPGLQFQLFSARRSSLVRPALHDSLRQIVELSGAAGAMSREAVAEYSRQFAAGCERVWGEK